MLMNQMGMVLVRSWVGAGLRLGWGCCAWGWRDRTLAHFHDEFARDTTASDELASAAGAVREATEALGHSWEGLEGVGTVDVDLTQGMRFFRLRRE